MTPAENREPRRRSRLSVWLLTAAFLVVVVGAVFVYVQTRGPKEISEDEIPLIEDEMARTTGDRSVVLVFPRWDASGFLREERLLPSRSRIAQDLLAVMNALCEGPTSSGATTAIPAGTQPLAAFYNESDGSVVLDFSRELVTNHPGGSAAENGTLTSILQTVALNFPEVRECTLLVAGAQTETLAGHISLDQPFVPRRWL
jgi:spore germination protein GerM